MSKKQSLTKQGVRDLSPKQVNCKSNSTLPCFPSEHKYYRGTGVCTKCGWRDPYRERES